MNHIQGPQLPLPSLGPSGFKSNMVRTVPITFPDASLPLPPPPPWLALPSQASSCWSWKTSGLTPSPPHPGSAVPHLDTSQLHIVFVSQHGLENSAHVSHGLPCRYPKSPQESCEWGTLGENSAWGCLGHFPGSGSSWPHDRARAGKEPCAWVPPRPLTPSPAAFGPLPPGQDASLPRVM